MENNKMRLNYIDNLRILMIIFVVMVHLAVTYSGIGGWYYKEVEADALDLGSKVFFAFFQMFTQGYFMGFLFLVAGFFVPGSYDRKGFSGFIKERLVRLGIPTLIYMLIISPFITFVILGNKLSVGKPGFIDFYTDYIRSLDFIGGSGPLWFAFALLIFSFIYAFIRKIGHSLGHSTSNKETKSKVTVLNAMMLILLIAVSAFLIRIVQPIDTNIFNMQLCFFAQYVILFIIGIKAYRNHLFEKIDYRFGKRFLLAGTLLGFILWAVVIVTSGALDGIYYLKGGLHWQSAAYALWESFVCVSVSIGLLGVFRKKCNVRSKLVKTMSDNSFAVYMFHPPIIVGLAILLRNVEMPYSLKFLAMCLICIPICFLAGHYVFRRIPLLKKVL